MLKKLLVWNLILCLLFSNFSNVIAIESTVSDTNILNSESISCKVDNSKFFLTEKVCKDSCTKCKLNNDNCWECEKEKSDGLLSSIGNFFKAVGNFIVNILKKIFGISDLEDTKDQLKNDIIQDTNTNTKKDNNDSILGDWIVKIKSDKGDIFEIIYPSVKSGFYISQKGVEETWEPPVIHIQKDSGFTKIGLNTDNSRDGEIIPITDKIVKVDADLYGYFNESINLIFKPEDNIVEIYSKLHKKSATFDLKSGEIKGDTEITKGYTNLFVFFSENNNNPFTVCVSDVDQYWANIGIFADLQTVAVGPCDNKKWWKPEKTPLKNDVYPPMAPPPVNNPPGYPSSKPPTNPKPPAGKTGGGNGGATTDAPPLWTPPDEASPPTQVGENTNGKVGIGSESNSFPTPENNPGEGYGYPKYNPDKYGEFVKKNKESFGKASEQAEKNREAINTNIKLLEDMLKEFGLSKPDIPAFDPGVCCPTYQKDGKCCSDLDMSKEADRREYIKRINCLVSEFWKTQTALNGLLSSVNFLTNRVAQLDQARANFALLAVFTNLQKGMMHVAIDVATGGGGWIKGVLKSAIGEIFGGDIAATASGDMEGLTKSATAKMFNEITDYKEKVQKVATEIADAMALKGNERKRFLDSMVSKFGDDPTSLADPSAWLKGIVDLLYDNAGGVAQDFVDTVNKMEENRNRDLKAAWIKLQLLKQINDVIDKVRIEECGKKYLTGIEEKSEELKKQRDERKRRFAQDSDYILKAIEWIMNNMFDEMTGDNPSPEKLKEKILKELQNRLCKLGFDLCWVDIYFEISFKKIVENKPNGKVTKTIWEIDKFYIIQRKTRKEPCPCPQKETSDNNAVTTPINEDTSVMTEYIMPDDTNVITGNNEEIIETSNNEIKTKTSNIESDINLYRSENLETNNNINNEIETCSECKKFDKNIEDDENPTEKISNNEEINIESDKKTEKNNEPENYLINEVKTLSENTKVNTDDKDSMKKYEESENSNDIVNEEYLFQEDETILPKEPIETENNSQCKIEFIENHINGYTYNLSDCPGEKNIYKCISECGGELAPIQIDEESMCYAIDLSKPDLIDYQNIIPCYHVPIPTHQITICVSNCLINNNNIEPEPEPEPKPDSETEMFDSEITEEELSICDKDSDCIIVHYNNCCGSTKKAINKKYLDVYYSNPERNGFQDDGNCALTGVCPSDHDINETYCDAGTCRFKY